MYLTLRGVDQLGRICVISANGDDPCDFLFVFLHTKPLIEEIERGNKESVHKDNNYRI